MGDLPRGSLTPVEVAAHQAGSMPLIRRLAADLRIVMQAGHVERKTARERQPHIESVLMSRALFDELSPTSAVVEGSPAGEPPPNGLAAAELELYAHLCALEKGRVEQERVPRERVTVELMEWRAGR